MVRLRAWQWVVLVSPIVLVVTIILVAAGWQLHTWGLSWIWAAVTLLLLGWRWLLVRWTQPVVQQMEAVVAQVSKDLEAAEAAIALPDASNQPDLELTLQAIFTEAQNDRPIWEDWTTFWLRCREVVVAIAHLYHPEVKYPLLNIYIPQAYGLIRGTVDDLDQWMQKLSPVLNQVTVGQAYQAYEVYQKLEPSARKLWQVWNWAQWILNPAAAVARQASRKSGDRATQQLLVNLGQMLRETALRNLARQAIALYGGSDSGSFGDSTSSSNPTISPLPPTFKSALPKAQTQTLRDILAQVEPVEAVVQKPVNLLVVGRTGAGKSSLINTLFQADLATVDMLPSTDQMQHYQWQTTTGETLTLWDTPGYEQVNRPEFRAQVLDYAAQADVLLLVTPALDPALQMDVDFLKDVRDSVAQLPAIAIVTQVDRLRPFREWEPPYDWEKGDRPKELAIREATRYRVEQLGQWCDRVLPVVTGDRTSRRAPWNLDRLSLSLVEAIAPAKQLRLARFLNDLDARTVAAATIIDRYTFQMATTQGLTAFLKSPVLQFISTLATGQPTLAYLLAEQIPVEQLPVVIGKLQMAYDLFNLLNSKPSPLSFDLLALWTLLLENPDPADRNAWAFGHTLVEYWAQGLTSAQLKARFDYYLSQRG